MSAIITECLMVRAAKGDKGSIQLLAQKIEQLRKEKHGQTWPCPHEPKCVATAAGQRRLARILVLFLHGPDEEQPSKPSTKSSVKKGARKPGRKG